jgi:hypothetical protein
MSGSNQTSLIARVRTLEPRPGVRFKTPLLIPSFSSKGFATSAKGKQSELNEVLKFIGSALTESVLFSAYDLYYKLLPAARQYLDKPQVVVMDSGGYEASGEYDEGQPFRPPYRHNKWSEGKLRQLLDSLPRHLRLVVVNHDSRVSLSKQAESASKFFSRYPQHVHNFLLKPTKTKYRTVDVSDLLHRVSLLRKFDIIGVTEKELGSSLLDRLINIHQLRVGLDKAEINAPIHVFGSLDPVTVPLFFAAGAEIFDGLSWLRYYFHHGLAVYRDHAGVLTENRGVQARWDHVRAFAISENVAGLRKLEVDLRSFAMSQDCSVFGAGAEVILRGVQSLKSSLHGGQ